MKESAVVVPVGSPSSTIAVHRSLGRRGIRTIGVAANASVPSFRSRHCDESVVVEDAQSDVVAYKDALLSLAMRPDVETIVPLKEEDVYVLSKYRDEFAAHVATPWPSFETLRTIHDRDALFEAARDVDVAVPETKPLDEVEDWGGELVVKSRYALLAGEYLPDESSEGLMDATPARFLESDERPDVAALQSAFGHTPHVQRFVDGTEYSLGVLYEDGEPVVETQKRILRGVKYYHGPSVYHETVDVPELEELGRKLLTHLDWHGPADIDVIQDAETGEYRLLEINPRFWATVQLEIHAGFDFPYYYLQLARGNDDVRAPPVRSGIRSHFLPGELSYLASVASDEHPVVERPSLPAAVRDVAGSVVRHPRFDVLSLDDPLPFVACMASTFGGVGRRFGGLDWLRSRRDSDSDRPQTGSDRPQTDSDRSRTEGDRSQAGSDGEESSQRTPASRR